MRRVNYIFLLVAVLLSGCSKDVINPDNEQVVVPTKPYIYLDAGVSTRASLVEGTVLNQDFGVYGFTMISTIRGVPIVLLQRPMSLTMFHKK